MFDFDLALPYRLETRALKQQVRRNMDWFQKDFMFMHAFVHLRQFIDSNRELATRLDDLESKYDEQFRSVFEAIRQLIHQEIKPRKTVGFRILEPQED